jgi:hypothetical protein
VACIAAAWLPLEIVIKGQLWRVFWLAAPLAALAVLDVVRQGDLYGRCLAPAWMAAAACVILAPRLFPVISLGSWIIAAAAGRPVADRIESRYRERHRTVAVIAALMWLAALPGLWADIARAGHRFVVPWWEGWDWLHGLVAGGLWPLPIALAWLLARHARKPALLAVAIAALLPAALHWDRRPPLRQETEGCYLAERCPPHPLRAWVNPGDSVLWDAHELDVWFRLHTQNFVSAMQGVGRVFSREKFVEWKARMSFAYRNPATGSTQLRDVGELCRSGGPRWLISQDARSPNAPSVAQWREGKVTWHLHRCSQNAGSGTGGSV